MKKKKIINKKGRKKEALFHMRISEALCFSLATQNTLLISYTTTTSLSGKKGKKNPEKC